MNHPGSSGGISSSIHQSQPCKLLGSLATCPCDHQQWHKLESSNSILQGTSEMKKNWLFYNDISTSDRN
jgi:hypothetical protein